MIIRIYGLSTEKGKKNLHQIILAAILEANSSQVSELKMYALDNYMWMGRQVKRQRKRQKRDNTEGEESKEQEEFIKQKSN